MELSVLLFASYRLEMPMGDFRHFRLELGVLSNRLVAERQGEALGIKKCSVSPPIFVSLLPANGISFTSFIHF